MADLGTQEVRLGKVLGASSAVVREDRLQGLVQVARVVCRRERLVHAIGLDPLLALRLLLVDCGAVHRTSGND